MTNQFILLPSADGRLLFNTLNLNTQVNSSSELEGLGVDVLCFQQIKRDTFFIGLDRILISKEGSLYQHL